MLSQNMEEKLNEHTNAEFYSAHLYLSMSAYFKSVDLLGFANWMQVQFEEEMSHAMRFFEFVDRMDGRVKLTAIPAPPVEWENPIAVFEETYKHEQTVSKSIHDLVSLAIQENDHPTNNFLQWFVSEQVEEESTAKTILKKLRFIEDSKSGLLMIDQELAGRVFAASSDESASA
ncbi:MAG: ferritin [Deltaproteobacteria bacterium]|jgi:ferritin|nr:ferritin [Deltaproteobacteria bacterium]MBT4087724.1 ferritin [Deltaproteobacteria bacterium]MBT4264663.1 ferritin [Deltaproteobacteria bacterium]MBT4644497.1 ferritin [Deltaproteobacteria bacterium]MBT6504845.1 ferritin [Deltaproteobacteria bacterium]